MKSKADAVIIGGGIIGCSVAFHLTRMQDFDAVLLDRGGIGQEETRVSAAMVMQQTQDQLTTPLAKMSAQEYMDTREYIGRDAGFRQTGSILYATDPVGAKRIHDIVRMQQKLDIPTEMLAGSDVKKYAPMVNSDDILAASYCPLDGYVDPIKLANLYAKYAGQHGVEISDRAEATWIDVKHGQVRGVETTSGYIETPIVVNAAGAWSGAIGRWVGITIPMVPNKRDIVIIPPQAEMPSVFPIMEDITTEWYFRPWNDQVLIGVGSTTPVMDIPNHSETPADSDVGAKVARFLEHRVPALAAQPIVGSWGGIRSLTPDKLPILGPVDGVEGFLNCCVLSGFGVTNAPVVGKLIAELVLKKQVAPELEPFLLKRFPESMMQWRMRAHELMIGDSTVFSVAKRFGTPLYLYNADIVLDRLKRVREAFPDFSIWYSVKSNPNPALLSFLAKLGVGASVTSMNDLELTVSAGFAPRRVAFGGPGKSLTELEQATSTGVGTIDVESPRELRTLEDLATRLDKKVAVSLRVNPLHKPSVAGEFMAGVESKFGFDEENILENLAGLSLKHVTIQGIHAHPASQVLDPSFFVTHYEKVAKLSKHLASTLNFDLKFISFGGGFGVPYASSESPVDIKTLGRRSTEILSAEFSDYASKPEFQIELGRYLVAECGIFLTEIMDLKTSRGTTFVITDSGLNALSRPAMPWAQQHNCSIVSKQDLKPSKAYRVVGRSCMPSDVLCKTAMLPDPEPGDILAVHNAGAYGYTMTMLLWSGLRAPLELVFADDKIKVVTERLRNPWMREALSHEEG